MSARKVPYVCGALTDVPDADKERIKAFYSAIGDTCEKSIGIRAFVPHEHYDPIKHADFTPAQVYESEKLQVCEKTSVLIWVSEFPSIGAGWELAFTCFSNIPVIHLQCRKVSRFPIGGLEVELGGKCTLIHYENEEEALEKLSEALKEMPLAA